MATLTVSRPAHLNQATIIPPGDKSISHRAIMLSAIGNGEATFKNFLNGEDCIATVNAFRAMGVEIDFLNPEKTEVRVKGVDKRGLKKPSAPLDMGNSGTTTRLLMGILAGQNFDTELFGDESLSSRPMKRVVEPLTKMGAKFSGPNNAETLPLTVHGSGKLKPIDYASKVASAQVKSAILLAGLYADGETSVAEPSLSRDHTERMLRQFGVELKADPNGLRMTIRGDAELKPQNLRIPGDISAAAFFIVAAALFRGTAVTFQWVGYNATRKGALNALLKMGAKIDAEKIVKPDHPDQEPATDLTVWGSPLKGVKIAGDQIPGLIDEIPVLAVAGALAQGTTEIRDAAELRVKETDRIKAMVEHLRALTGEKDKIQELPDGMIIQGPLRFKGGTFDSFGDHRIAMAMAVAGLFSEKPVTVTNTDCIKTSYPNFVADLKKIAGASCVKEG